MNFDINAVNQAQELISEFQIKAERVAKLAFPWHRICGMCEATVYPESGVVDFSYWDGYDAENFANSSIVFPFEYLNKTDDELKLMGQANKIKHDEELLRKKQKEAEERDKFQKERDEIRKTDGFKKFMEMQKEYEKYV